MRRRFLPLLLLMLAPQVVAEAGDSDSRYQRTVTSLQSAEPELRARWASTALLALAEIYIAEADLARNEAQVSESPARLRAWSRAVDQYAEQLVLVLEDIELGLPVELRNNPREVTSISVGGRNVMLAHPRSGQQLAYELQVLTAFCTGNTCTHLTVEREELEPIPASVSTISPHWDFSAGGPMCRYRNLEIQFLAGGDLGRQRSLCQQLLQELEGLATELAWQQRHAVSVSWGQLDLRPTPGRPEHLVVLNDVGDTVLATLPLLYGTPGLLATVSPWLEQRHSREGPVPLSIDASDMGWEKKR